MAVVAAVDVVAVVDGTADCAVVAIELEAEVGCRVLGSVGSLAEDR